MKKTLIRLTVSTIRDPSLSSNPEFAVDTPHVSTPKLRVTGRPRKAMAVASPERAVKSSVRTATGPK